MKVRKPPIRTCVGCGATSDKRELVRVVRTTDGGVRVDPTGKATGRGAYLCARHECFDAALAKRRLNSALRVNLREDDLDELRREYETLLAGTADSQQGR